MPIIHDPLLSGPQFPFNNGSKTLGKENSLALDLGHEESFTRRWVIRQQGKIAYLMALKLTKAFHESLRLGASRDTLCGRKVGVFTNGPDYVWRDLGYEWIKRLE